MLIKSKYTYLLTPWCRVLLEKLTGLQLDNKLPAFHGTRRFITALTSVRHLSLSWASPIQSIYPHPTSWRSVLILSTRLRLGLPSGLFPSGFPTKTLYTPLSSPIHATCPAHLILLDFITRTILGRSTNHLAPRYAISSIPPVTSSLLGPNILNLNIPFIILHIFNNKIKTRFNCYVYKLYCICISFLGYHTGTAILLVLCIPFPTHVVSYHTRTANPSLLCIPFLTHVVRYHTGTANLV